MDPDLSPTVLGASAGHLGLGTSKNKVVRWERPFFWAARLLLSLLISSLDRMDDDALYDEFGNYIGPELRDDDDEQVRRRSLWTVARQDWAWAWGCSNVWLC
jgi:hypothetical protein